MPMVPTNNHPLFDGTQTSLGPLKLGATYLGKALVWVAGCFTIATIEVFHRGSLGCHQASPRCGDTPT
jgi:hypothetical protein